MTTYYGFDSQLIYTGPIEVAELTPVPANVTEVPPPEVTLPQVAKWQGVDGWVILDERPRSPEPSEAELIVVIPEEYPIDKINYLKFFTQAERIAIKQAAKTDPTVEDYQYMLDSSGTVLLNEPYIKNGVEYLEQTSVLAPGRAKQVLGRQIPA